MRSTEADEPEDLAALMQLQRGVVTRRQVLQRGGCPADLQRRIRRREWVRLLPGVFVDHTGEPTWWQRAWAGVLFYDPAVLADQSAVRASRAFDRSATEDSDPIWIAVTEDRHVRSRPGYRVRRLVDLDRRAQWNLSPPRLRVEEALLDRAGRASSELGALAVLTDACQAGRTTAGRLKDALDERGRLTRGRWLTDVLTDLAAGTCSVLEHGYLTRVERPHGLPVGRRQVRDRSEGAGVVYRDVDYDPVPLLVELDGRAFHDNAIQRDRDLDRDLEAAAGGRATVRLGWGQVFDRACVTAGRVGQLLAERGWTGSPVRCGRDCAL